MSTKKRKSTNAKGRRRQPEESRTLSSSRARSLPVLAKVRYIIERKIVEARREIWREREYLIEKEFNYQRWHGRLDVLLELEKELVRIKHEAPEGIDELRHGNPLPPASGSH